MKGLKPTMTTQEVADYLGISSDAVIRLKDKRVLPSLRGFRQPFRFSGYQIEDYLRGKVVN